MTLPSHDNFRYNESRFRLSRRAAAALLRPEAITILGSNLKPFIYKESQPDDITFHFVLCSAAMVWTVGMASPNETQRSEPGLVSCP